MILAAPAGRALEDNEQRDHGERRDHQQLVIVDIGNDLRLLRDRGVERGASGCGEWIPKTRDAWVGENPIDGSDVLHDVGVVNLRVLYQQAVHHRDADAGADVA